MNPNVTLRKSHMRTSSKVELGNLEPLIHVQYLKRLQSGAIHKIMKSSRKGRGMLEDLLATSHPSSTPSSAREDCLEIDNHDLT